MACGEPWVGECWGKGWVLGWPAPAASRCSLKPSSPCALVIGTSPKGSGEETNSSLWSACYAPDWECQQNGEPETVSTAYLSGRLHVIIPSVTADRGIERSAHSRQSRTSEPRRLQWR